MNKHKQKQKSRSNNDKLLLKTQNFTSRNLEKFSKIKPRNFGVGNDDCILCPSK